MASRWQGGRQSPHLHDRQQELVALPEEAQDDAFKIPATHRRQIPERACLITANGVDKTKWTQHSEHSAAQPEVALDSVGRLSMLPPGTSACRVECCVHVPSCVWPLQVSLFSSVPHYSLELLTLAPGPLLTLIPLQGTQITFLLVTFAFPLALAQWQPLTASFQHPEQLPAF